MEVRREVTTQEGTFQHWNEGRSATVGLVPNYAFIFNAAIGTGAAEGGGGGMRD